MSDEFVKKEVFDARMDRMEALLEKTLTEMKMDNEKLRSEVSSAVSKMQADNEKLRSENKEEISGLRSEVSSAVGKMQADNEKLRSENKEEISGLRSEMRENNARLEAKIEVVNTRIDALSTRIDSVQTTVYWGFALMGLILAFTTFAPALLEFVKGLRRPAVVLDTKLREDVDELRKTVLALVEAGKRTASL